MLVLPSLAVAIGVNQAILLQQLHFLSRIRKPDRAGLLWVELGNGDLLHTFPFWSRNTVWRMVDQLRERGLLAVKTTPGSAHSYRVDYDAVEALLTPEEPADTLPKVGTDPTQDGQGTLPNLGRASIKEFEEVKIPKQNGGEEGQRREADQALIARDWRPDEVTLAAIKAGGIPLEFAQQVLPEFRLYWTERAERRSTWGAPFAAHVRRQWSMRPPERAARPSPGKGPATQPADAAFGHQPPARDVIARHAADPAKLAPLETRAARMAEIKKDLNR